MRIYICILTFITCALLHGQNDPSSTYTDEVTALTEKMWDHYYYQQDSAYYYIDKIAELASKNKDSVTLVEALLNSNGVASYHYNLKRSGNDISRLEDILRSNLNKGSSEYLTNENMLLYYKGAYNLKLYEYRKSRKIFERIIENTSRIPDSLKNETLRELSSVALSFIGKIYLEEGKYDLAKQFYNKDIRGIMEHTPDKIEYIYDNYNLLAEVFKEEKNYREANNYLLKTYDYNKAKNNLNSVITTAFNISQNYNHLGQKDSALFYLSEAKSKINDNPAFVSKYHLIKAEIRSTDKEYKMALLELDSVVEITNELSKKASHKSLNTPIALNEMGKILALQNRFHQALEKYERGIKELSGIGNARTFLIKMLKNKSASLNATLNEDSVALALKSVDQGVAELDRLKPTFKSQSDKLVLIEDVFPLFESGLEAAYNLNAIHKNDSLINKAFLYAEKSKSVLLLEALLSTQATKFANIPSDLLSQESQLKSGITFVEKQINNAQGETAELENQLFALKSEHRGLIESIETTYPAYYDLKYNTNVISVGKTQELLANDELVLSYFYGSKAIYLLALAKESKALHKISLSQELEEQIKNVRQKLADPNTDVAVLNNESYELYRKLLYPILETTPKTRLLIIPDGLLNYIPFGSLNTQKNGIRYVIEDKTIAYANSATLWSQLKERKNDNNSVLAFAPSFENNHLNVDIKSAQLLPLPHNKREVEQILTSFEGDLFLGSEASLSNFNAQITAHGILHLATHAIFDDTSPEYSYLAFAPHAKEESLLYVRDLYNLSLNAGMVTLSACESAIGELKRGEGFLSLTRGFFYSGAASITSTLWKINDASTTTLMDSFYKNLAQGDKKDLALQKAKKSFLEQNEQNALAHPYYWSGFVVSGNTAPLASLNLWRWIVLGIFILTLAGIFLFSRKKKTSIQRLQ